jgi:hypothetical protein
MARKKHALEDSYSSDEDDQPIDRGVSQRDLEDEAEQFRGKLLNIPFFFASQLLLLTKTRPAFFPSSSQPTEELFVIFYLFASLKNSIESLTDKSSTSTFTPLPPTNNRPYA